jgi:hypothetical protein
VGQVLLRATDNDTQERRMRTYAVDELTPVTEIELPSGIFSLTEDTLGIMHSFLEKSNACLYAEEATGTDPSPATLLYAQIRSRLLKVLESLFRDSASIRCCLDTANERDRRLIPLLIEGIAAREDDSAAAEELQDHHIRQRHSNVRGKTEEGLVRLAFDLQESLYELESRPKRAAAESEPTAETTTEEEPAKQLEMSPNDSKRRGKSNDASKNRRKREERKTRGKGKPRLEMDSDSDERIKTALAGNWRLGQNKMAWSEDCGYAVVFVGLDRLSIQYYGNNGDCLVHALPEISADTMEEFYYEVALESDDSGSGIGVGLCPAGSVPGNP